MSAAVRCSGKVLGKGCRRSCPPAATGRDAAQSIDVLVEVGGAPDDDHPDRQHETDGKSCTHLFPPCLNAYAKGLALFYDIPSARAIPIKPFGTGVRRLGDRSGSLLGKIEDVKRGKTDNRRGKANAEHVAHIMSGRALPRLFGRHHGARPASSEFRAVLRRTHGHSLNAVLLLKITNGLGREFP